MKEQSSDPNPASVVSVVNTSPDVVLEDVGNAMRLAGYQQVIPKERDVILKINISWEHWYPGCSTSPWQLEGVINALQQDGYGKIIGGHNGTVVVDSFQGAIANKHTKVTDQYRVPVIHLDSEPNKWIPFQPKRPLLVLDKIFPNGLMIPESLPGKSVIHLPTMKTHVFTTITGAMKNAFGGLLNQNRHWTHSVIHETLVDLLAIQKELHPGIFGVLDGTFAGDGPGPRAMRWHTPGVLLASSDLVALDAIAAKMMGFDPMAIPFIRLAHEAGLGCGDPSKIEIVGSDIEEVNFNFVASENTLASRGQKLIYWGPLKPMEGFLLRSFIAPWAFWASNLYHNVYWLNFIGKRRVRKALESPWGKLFLRY